MVRRLGPADEESLVALADAYERPRWRRAQRAASRLDLGKHELARQARPGGLPGAGDPRASALPAPQADDSRRRQRSRGIHERVLKDGTPDPWLETTRDENLVDLGWHQKDFELRRSFTYADVDLPMWLRRNAWEAGVDPELEEAVKNWLDAKWPFERIVFRECD